MGLTKCDTIAKRSLYAAIVLLVITITLAVIIYKDIFHTVNPDTLILSMVFSAMMFFLSLTVSGVAKVVSKCCSKKVEPKKIE